MSERSQIKVGVIATVVGTLIVTAILTVLGKWSVIAAWLYGRGAAFLVFATTDTLVPAWSILVLIVTLALLAHRIRELPKRTIEDDLRTALSSLPSSGLPQAGSVERRVLSVLVEHDGQALTLSEVVGETNEHQTLVISALHDLIKSGLIRSVNEPLREQRFELTDAGRKAAIGGGLVGSSTVVSAETFTPEQLAVLKAFVAANNSYLTVAELAAHLNLKPILVEHVVDVLSQRRLLDNRMSKGRGWSYRLNHAGRAAAVQERLV